MALFTPQAADAIDWLFKRIPEQHFDAFQGDMELAISSVLQKYGFDQALIDGFNVTSLVADRAPLFMNVKVTVYEGDMKYAHTKDGKMFVKKATGWEKTPIKLPQVKRMSITAVPDTINIRSDML